MASPFFARALFELSAIDIAGPIARFASSGHLDRAYCRNCGTRIGAFRSNGTAAGLALALFDDRNAFAPTEHIWTSEKVAWLTIADGLPQHLEGPPPA